MDKLAEIMAWKHRELAPRLRTVSPEDLAAAAARLPRPPSFHDAVRRADRLAVIAEIKRRSPSAGAIAPAADPRDQAIRYRDGGADALSVLTDERYFGGTLADLQAVSNHLGPKGPPRLRKDFTIHPLQILEALEAGASAILLIVRALEDDALLRLREAADAAGLASLFEIHSEPELERALRAGASIIGVNNRDLAAFRTDLALSERLIPQIPAPIVRISESGIATAADAARARAAGADAILVGEALMRAPDPAELLGALAVA